MLGRFPSSSPTCFLFIQPKVVVDSALPGASEPLQIPAILQFSQQSLMLFLQFLAVLVKSPCSSDKMQQLLAQNSVLVFDFARVFVQALLRFLSGKKKNKDTDLERMLGNYHSDKVERSTRRQKESRALKRHWNCRLNPNSSLESMFSSTV